MGSGQCTNLKTITGIMAINLCESGEAAAIRYVHPPPCMLRGSNMEKLLKCTKYEIKRCLVMVHVILQDWWLAI